MKKCIKQLAATVALCALLLNVLPDVPTFYAREGTVSVCSDIPIEVRAPIAY